MSTKVTLAHGTNFELFQDIFDVNNVHLTLNGIEFEATHHGLKVSIPTAIWEIIRQHAMRDDLSFFGE